MKRIPLLTMVSALGIVSASAADMNDRMMAAPVVAPAPTFSAIGSVWLGGVLLDTEDGGFDGGSIFAAGGDAHAYFEVMPQLGLQAEFAGVFHGNADDDGGEAGHYLVGGLHVIRRSGDYAFGAFAAASHTQANDNSDDFSHIFGGVEGSMFRGMNQFYAQLGGHTAVGDDEDDTWDEGIFATAGFRHFFTENSALKFNGAIGGGGNWDGDEEAIWLQWGAEYEHQFSGTPLSVFAGYQGDYLHDRNDSDADDNLINHTFKVGIRGTFGDTRTVYAAARDGAGTFSLPDLHAPFVYTTDLW